MKKHIAVFLIVFSFFASTGIALRPTLTPFFQRLFNSVTASSPHTQSETTPAATIGNGDINGDSLVNWEDLWLAIQGWDTKDETLDEYKDGKVNAMDASVVMKNFK